MTPDLRTPALLGAAALAAAAVGFAAMRAREAERPVPVGVEAAPEPAPPVAAPESAPPLETAAVVFRWRGEPPPRRVVGAIEWALGPADSAVRGETETVLRWETYRPPAR